VTQKHRETRKNACDLTAFRTCEALADLLFRQRGCNAGANARRWSVCALHMAETAASDLQTLPCDRCVAANCRWISAENDAGKSLANNSREGVCPMQCE